MVAIKLKGLKKVTRKLATGERCVYWYAWAGGPRLDGKPGTPEFVASYNQAVEGRKAAPEDTIGGLATKYRASANFKKLSPASRRAYDSYLNMIIAKFGKMSLKVTQDKRARGFFLGWRDTMADTPRKADYVWSVLSKLLAFGKDRGLLEMNPCERGGRLYDADRTEILWTEDDLASLFAVCSKEVRAAVIFALWTGQRQGDVLRMPWSAYKGGKLRFRQAKTRREMVIPVGEPLAEVIASLPRHSTVMLTSSDKTPWTSDGFRASFRKACAKAKVGHHFHDLRGTAVTRLAMVGCSALEIASFTGHSEKDVSAMLDRHYLGNREQLAEAALRKLETGTKSGKRLENGDSGTDKPFC